MGKTGRKTKTGEDEFISLDSFLWKTVEKAEKVVYRGQCAASTKDIPRRGENPLEILTDLTPVKPISTSSMLTPKIESFACFSEKGGGAAAGAGRTPGRIFEIHLTRGVRFTSMYDQIPEIHFREMPPEEKMALFEATFGVVQAEMDPENSLKEVSLNGLFGLFFNFLGNEKEILLDPRTIHFVQADLRTPELWANDLVTALSFHLDKKGGLIFRNPKNAKLKERPRYWEQPGRYETHEVPVYRTYVVPRMGGGRRRKTLRRRRDLRRRKTQRKANHN